MKPNQLSGRPGKAQGNGSGLRLLVVEDYGDLCMTLERVFALLGHRARFVGNVASALRAADEEPFDVLLSDIGLPDGTGWELLRRLEETGHKPPHAIAMSGYGLEVHLSQSAEAGFDLHLIKPFPPETLEAVLNTAARELSNSINPVMQQPRGSDN